MASGDKVYIADKTTLDSVNTKVGSSSDSASSSGTTLFALLKDAVSNVSSLATYWTSARATKVDGIGSSSDTASSSGTTLFALLKQAVTDSARLTSTRAGYIDRIANSTYGLDKIKTVVDTASSNASSANTAIGETGNTGGSATAGTVMGKLNKLLTDWTSTKAGYLDAKVSSAVNYIAEYNTTTTLVTFTSTTASGSSYSGVYSSWFTAPYSGTYRIDLKFQFSSSTGTAYVWAYNQYASLYDKLSSSDKIQLGTTSVKATGTDYSVTYGLTLPAGARVRFSIGETSSFNGDVTLTSGTVKYKKVAI